jgi:hypothetical protein
MVIVLLLGGCVVGAPPGFSPGEAWTFPLVDPLVKEPLITTVMVGGKGPFLFVLDPDAPTGIDIELIPQIPTVGNAGYWAPLTDVQVGTLHVDSLSFVARKQHTFDVGGRRIYGVIGREVFTNGLVFGFDRDRGIAWLATPRHAQLPANARVLEYWTRHGAPMVTGSIDGREREFHIDLGRFVNQLRTDDWDGLAVSSGERRIVLADASWRTTDKLATARHVDLGTLEQAGVTFVPFVERELTQNRSATLGLDFFWRFAVAMDFDHQALHLAPRTTVDRAARIGRWNLACKHVGCADLALHGKDLEVRPEHTPIQLRVRATATDGTALPDLEVDLASGAGRFAVALEDRYTDATFEVIDASPFPRTCVDGTECVVPAP